MKTHGPLNHIFRLIWSEVLNCWVAVAEQTRGRGKGASRRLTRLAAAMAAAAGALTLPLALSHAAPLGGQVTAGAGTIAQSGTTITINQTSQNLSLGWKSFNVGVPETVNFVQPSASAIAVNRIADTNASQILGHLNANGQVYLINPNGIVFGQSAQVNVGGLVASTLDTGDTSLNGPARGFSGNGTGSIVNNGAITAMAGGYVALLGQHVSNQGTITAQLGTVALGAGNAATLTFQGTALASMKIDQSVLDTLIENGGLIRADGGQVLMTAGSRDTLLASVVNNTGVIEARTLNNQNGTISLLGSMAAGTVNVGGTLDASAPIDGNGGAIETSAHNVHVAKDATITTHAASGLNGSWLVDPVDFTIAASGGDITGAQLSTDLANNNITIQTNAGTNTATSLNANGSSGNGNINVNDMVTWSANLLRLSADNNININSTMTASGTAGLALQYGQGATDGVINSMAATYNVNAPVNLASTGSFSTQLGSNGSLVNYKIITALGADQTSVTKTDLQGINGNLAGNYALGSNIDATATSAWNSGAGFAPIAIASSFTGNFDGLGHTISNLTVNTNSVTNVGLFGATSAAAVLQNVALVGESITGSQFVGGLVGNNLGTINASSVTGSINGSQFIGGLAGYNNGVISNSYASGSLASNNFGGGLVGKNEGSVSNSYATNSVSGFYDVGGLLAMNYGAVTNTYATGAVSGAYNVGGLIGVQFSGLVSTSYAKSVVQGSSDHGGFIGNMAGGAISNSFWNTDNTAAAFGVNSAPGVTGLNTKQMQNSNNLIGFNFTTKPGAAGWVIINADGSLNTNGTPGGGSMPMLASEYSNIVHNAHQLQLMDMNLSANYILANDFSATATHTNTDVWGSEGFVPIGGSSGPFSGNFNGMGHSIADIGIIRPTQYDIGLFGATSSNSVIRSVGLLGGSIVGGDNGAGLGNDGALVGLNGGSVVTSYSTASVNGSANSVGGLVGGNHGSINMSYATGSVSGNQCNGGLVGNNYGSVSDSYATGNMSGSSSFVGGLIGYNGGPVTNSYWNSSVISTGIRLGNPSSTAIGLTTAGMMTQANFSGFDFANIWTIFAGHSDPVLNVLMTQLTITAGSAIKDYNGLAQSTTPTATYSSTPNVTKLSGVLSYSGLGTNTTLINAGSYAIIPSGLTSSVMTQQGYYITYVNGALTINRAL